MEALFSFGEWAIYVLLWRTHDEQSGLVKRCQVCFVGEGRSAAAYRQGSKMKCPDCFGTTFEGGYRARVIRPTLFTDRVTDTIDAARGTLVTDTVTAETTGDFTFHHGDYIFRAGGSRYQAEQKNTVTIRSGFGNPDSVDSIAGTISVARLEDIDTVAWTIPPDQATVEQILRRPVTEHLPADLAAYEVVNRGPLIL